MNIIRKARRESFGGIIYSEHPGFTVFIDNEYANKLGLEKLKNLPENVYSVPLDVHMSLTNQCNLYCKGCYSLNEQAETKEIDLNLAKSIVDNLAKLNVFTVSLGGGEPLLYSHIFDLAQYIRIKNIAPNITTNGTLIDLYIAKLCKVFSSIHLSLHSMDDMKILETAVGNLGRQGIIPGLNLLLTEENFQYLDQIFKWVSNIGIKKILLLRFKITRNMSIEQEKSLYPTIKKLSQKYNVIPMIDCSLYPAIAIHGPNKKDLVFYDVNGCQGGHSYIAIDLDGNYKPCSFWPESFGSALTLTHQEWQDNELLNNFRRQRLNNSCNSCQHLNACNSGCKLVQSQICFK
ncbi:MAG: radical SAM protein [Eubacteriales bacterium]